GQGALFARNSPILSGTITLTGDTRIVTESVPDDGLGGGFLTLSGSIQGSFDLTLTDEFNGSAGAVEVSGPIPNRYGATQVIGVSLILNKSVGVNAIPGPFIDNGLVEIKSAEQIPDTAPVTIGGTLVLRADETIGPLTLNGGTIGNFFGNTGESRDGT